MKMTSPFTNVTRQPSARNAEPASSTVLRRGYWLPLLCGYLVIVQPILLFVLPLAAFDQDRLPAWEPVFLLSLSITAWRNVFLAVAGICAGWKLWLARPSATTFLWKYLVAAHLTAFVMVVMATAVPYHSFLRKTIQINITLQFLQTLAVLAGALACLRLARLWPDTVECSESAPGSRRIFSPGGAGVAFVSIVGVLGLVFSVVAANAKPETLFEAAWEGDLARARDLVAAGAEINSAIPDGSIPLHLARTGPMAEWLLASESRLEQSFLVTPRDFRDMRGLIDRLRNPPDAAAAYLWTNLPEETRRVLQAPATIANPDSLPEASRQAMADAWNLLLREHRLHEEPPFAAVTLSRDTLALRSRRPRGVALTHLNRLMFDDAFGAMVARYHVEWRNGDLQMPLHLAAWNGRLEVAEVLLQHGADINAQDRLLMTPLDLALWAKDKHRPGNHRVVIDFLLDHGGKANHFQHRLNNMAEHAAAARERHGS